MNLFRNQVVSLLATGYLLGVSAVAGEPDEEEERATPSVRSTAIPREVGEWQITLGAAFEDEDDTRSVELTLGAEYGLTERLELSCEIPYQFIKPKGNEGDVDGVGDFTMGGKFLLLQKGPAFLSASLDVTFPTADDDRNDELGDGRFEFEPMLLVDVGLEPIELFVGVGGELNEDQCSVLYEVTPTYIIVEDWEVSLGLEGKVNDEENELVIIPALAFPIWEDIEGGIEFPVGLTRESSNWGVKVEVAWDF